MPTKVFILTPMSSEEPSAEVIAQIGEALSGGQKIEAIKLYREATGKDLRSAKDFIETLGSKLYEQDPEKYAALANSGKGCPLAMIVFCAAVFAIAALAHLILFQHAPS
ncbi:MAG: hypothetical protein AAGH89_06215 [Verrucomicrobiota bacterium]